MIEKLRDSVLKRIDLIPEYHNLFPNKLNFLDIFQNNALPRVIAEIKFKSPSESMHHKSLPATSLHVVPAKAGTQVFTEIGDSPNFENTWMPAFAGMTARALNIAQAYIANQAAAISILTEPELFHGNINYISEIRKNFPFAHILQKDFILSKKQINQALAHGANAILLIVAFLEESLLKELYDHALSLNLTPLIEVHTLQELEIAKDLNPSLIGINNRNLKTLEIDLNTSRELIKHIPDHIHVISESGITHSKYLKEFQSLGFDGFLIGSHFMKSNSPGNALNEMIKGADHES